MRMLLRAVVDTEAGNEAVRSGAVADLIKQTLELLKPEAAYFAGEDGQRGFFVVFDMTDPSQLPVICEPIFQGVNAKIMVTPCMNLEDLQKGLSELRQQTAAQG